MAASPLLARWGLRVGTVGAAASLALALGTAVDAAARIGFYSDATAGAEKIGTVVGGVTGPTYTRNGATVDASFPGAVSIGGALTLSGAVAFPVGAVGAPSITFAGDLDTGLYHPAADQVGVTIGGTLRGLWSASGLDVTGYVQTAGDATSAAGGIAARGGTTPLAAVRIGVNSSTQYFIQANLDGTASRSLCIQPFGSRVLVGTTTDDGSTMLQVAGAGTFSSTLNVTGATTLGATLTCNANAVINRGGGNETTLEINNSTSGWPTIRMLNGSTHYAFMLSANNNVNNALEFTPATAVGGTTFSTPAMNIFGGTGAVVIGSNTDDATNKFQVTGASKFTGAVTSTGLITGATLKGTGYTAGRVPYIAAAGVIGDSATFLWDDANAVLTAGLATAGTVSSNALFTYGTFSASGNAGLIVSSVGDSYLNGASGRSVFLRINGTPVVTVAGTAVSLDTLTTITQTTLGSQTLVVNHNATGASTVSVATFQAGNSITTQTTAGVLDVILGAIEAGTDVFARFRSNGTNKILFFGDGSASYTGNLTVGGTFTVTGKLSISSAGASTFTYSNAGTTDTPAAQILDRRTSGTPAAGFGVKYAVLGQSDTTVGQDLGSLVWSWATATHASRKSRLIVNVSDAANDREVMRGEASGSAAMIGFLGATAIVRPTSTTDLRTALINLGLYTTGGATPLDLNGGALTCAALNCAALTASGVAQFTNATDSTSAGNGAVVVSGGVGVLKNVVCRQSYGVGITSTVTAAGTTTMSNASTGVQTFSGTTTQTVTLPAANSFGTGASQVLMFKNLSTGTVTIQRAGSDTINSTASNVTSFTLAQWASCILVSDGAATWQRI